jgi:hypothetical protein
VRFQAATLSWSRCFKESDDRLDCVTCHNPHQDVETKAAHYEARCLLCHAGAGAETPRAGDSSQRRLPAGLKAGAELKPCPMSPQRGCIGCHMPTVRDVIPHSAFTDHFIRVHRD